MIDEAIGKILGMAMAYVASAAGMFVAYYNYRRRIVKADKVMTPAAWTVIAVTVLATLGGVVVVGQLAAGSAAEEAPALEAEVAAAPPIEDVTPVAAEPAEEPERSRWSWIGIIVPAAIFLFATIVTTALHRHFSNHGQ